MLYIDCIWLFAKIPTGKQPSSLTGAAGSTHSERPRGLCSLYTWSLWLEPSSPEQKAPVHTVGSTQRHANTHASTGLPSARGGNAAPCGWFAALKNCLVCLLGLTCLLRAPPQPATIYRGSRSKRLSPPMRKSSPATYCMSSCCLQQPSTPMIHPNRMMETAMPMKPAVILRRSEERERRQARKETRRWQHPDMTARGESRQIQRC